MNLLAVAHRVMADPYNELPTARLGALTANGYGSSLKEASERCTRCGGTGLVVVADEREQQAGGHEPPPLGRAE